LREGGAARSLLERRHDRLGAAGGRLAGDAKPARRMRERPLLVRAVRVERRGRHALERAARDDSLAAGETHAATKRRVTEQALDRGAQPADVTRLDEEAGDPVLHGLRDSADLARYDGPAVCHRL